MDSTRVVIFARYPEAGAVKSRMSPPLSGVEAAELHRASLRAVCELVGRAFRGRIGPAGGGATRGRAAVLVTPDERVGDLAGELRRLGVACRPQGDGDLGQRLVRAAREAWEAGAEAVLFLGADSPTLPAAYLRAAVEALEQWPAAVGPCEDGGYYAIGLRRELSRWEALFADIPWGGPEVFETTCRRATEAGLELHVLPAWYDLDRYDDLARALGDLDGAAASESPVRPEARALRELIARLVATHACGGMIPS